MIYLFSTEKSWPGRAWTREVEQWSRRHVSLIFFLKKCDYYQTIKQFKFGFD